MPFISVPANPDIVCTRTVASLVSHIGEPMEAQHVQVHLPKPLLFADTPDTTVN